MMDEEGIYEEEPLGTRKRAFILIWSDLEENLQNGKKIMWFGTNTVNLEKGITI